MSTETWRAGKPVLRLTPRQFLDLPEYSTTFPTGTTPGKRWRRLDGAYDTVFIRKGGKPKWMIGEYDPNDDGKGPRIKINWYRPVIVVRAGAVILDDAA
ncbi:hypothetical protein BA190_09515 [Labrys sp. WJW]|uniref:hypothetical protein n=1 Tax=Labrys sp. WJW TaxID=1737983 RepID=UPI0008359A86|nr:hypothetical protein [Labrys sp. WJW]OCC05144.1 hypothetical protein BA190_09515 [Labrys sp. WJW]